MNQEHYCLDANVFITAWNHLYPIDVIPTFWAELVAHKEKILIIAPIFREIDPISSNDKSKLTSEEIAKKYPLRTWLLSSTFSATQVDNKTNELALQLEFKYEIRERKDGASPNDILLIAYAKLNNKTIVTLEKHQLQAPSEKYNYRIPLIAKSENVRCIDVIELLRELQIEI